MKKNEKKMKKKKKKKNEDKNEKKMKCQPVLWCQPMMDGGMGHTA